MDIEKQLEVLRKSLEDGATVEVRFSLEEESKAVEVVSQFSSQVNKYGSTNWKWAEAKVEGLDLIAFYPNKEQSA